MHPNINLDGLCKIKVPLNLIEKINKSIYQKYYVTCFSGLSEKINKMNDKEFSITAQKINRFFDKEVCTSIEHWIKGSVELKNILNYKKLRISSISPYESKNRADLEDNHLDIFFRLVRQHKKDVGPPHYDQLIWSQVKDSDAEVKLENKENRWKLWIPLNGVNEENSLQFVRGSHLEDVPWFMDSKRITQSSLATGKVGSPAIDEAWLLRNENNFRSVVWESGESVLFHDKLVHKGPINHSSMLRTSTEFTILCTN